MRGLMSIFAMLAAFLDKGNTVHLVYTDIKSVWPAAPWDGVTKAWQVGQELAMGAVVAGEQRVPWELSVNGQKEGFLVPKLIFLLLAVVQKKLARGTEHRWVF